MNDHEYIFVIILAHKKIAFIRGVLRGTMCEIVILKEFPLRGRKDGGEQNGGCRLQR